MCAIKMSLAYKSPTVELSCAFIDYYMPKCTITPMYALIYIYSLRRCMEGVSTVSSQDIAQTFQILETDVLNAWRYWENAGLIKSETREDGMVITFLPVSVPESLPEVLPARPAAAGNIRRFAPAARPQYAMEELTVYRQQSKDVERLFTHAEQTLGKLLSFHDINVLFGFYDWLRLPMDVILYMLTYCADNDHRDLRYIEKVALDWAEKQIDDLEKALAYVHTFNKDYNVILKIMGQTTGYPTPSQLKYINKWLQEYEMPTELALLACDRAAVNEGRPTFKYVDGIITNWHKKGIHTVADAETDDADFEKKKPDGKARANGKTNRFVNFKQRERDYNQLEKLEREYLTQSLKG